jgi:hypothetical protein
MKWIKADDEYSLQQTWGLLNKLQKMQVINMWTTASNLDAVRFITMPDSFKEYFREHIKIILESSVLKPASEIKPESVDISRVE